MACALWVTVPLSGGAVPNLGPNLGVDCEVSIEGVFDKDLRAALEEVSDTILLRMKHPPATVRSLRRRAEADIPRFLEVLRAEGYFGAKASVDVDADVKPVRVRFEVDPGPRYPVASVEIEVDDEGGPSGLATPSPNDFGLRLGQAARAQDILAAEEGVRRYYERQGFPFTAMERSQVIVDHSARSVKLAFRVKPGTRARFGPTRILGLETVEEAFLRSRITWREGDLYDVGKLDEARDRLASTNLIATVQIREGESLDQNNLLPMVIEVTESKHRSIGAGISYRTDEGPGGNVSWTHRNLFGRGESLGLKGTASDFTLAAESEFRKPDFMRADQAFKLAVRVAEDQPDAYTSRSVAGTAMVERELSKTVVVGTGLGVKIARVDQLADEESFSLLFVPLLFNWHKVDDLLDPATGGSVAAQAAPYFDTALGDLGFFKGRVSAARYLQVAGSPRLVLAGRISLGEITGAEHGDIPADERFYAGGGGSIRGYAYQSVGPLEDNKPLGGRSLVEAATELRLRVSEDFGLVAFLDGGSAFASTLFDSDEQLRWGAGLGLRYYTVLGPLRLDVGFPLNRRTDVDDSFQVYLSIGQAF